MAPRPRRADDADMTMNSMQGAMQRGEVPLRRPQQGRMIAGVAAGIAEYLGIDVTVVRVGLVVLGLVGGFGFPLYIAAWLIMPAEGAAASPAEEWLGRRRAGEWTAEDEWTAAHGWEAGAGSPDARSEPGAA